MPSSCQWNVNGSDCVCKWIWLLPFSPVPLGQVDDARATLQAHTDNRIHLGPWIDMWYRAPLLTHIIPWHKWETVLTSWPTKILELSLIAGSTNSALSWYQRHREIMQLPQGHEASKWPSLQPISYPVYHISTLVKAKSVMGLGRQRKHSSKCSMTT